jgi:hypothetical protein
MGLLCIYILVIYLSHQHSNRILTTILISSYFFNNASILAFFNTKHTQCLNPHYSLPIKTIISRDCTVEKLGSCWAKKIKYSWIETVTFSKIYVAPQIITFKCQN